MINLPWVSPLVFHVNGIALPAHLLFDLLAYSGGFQLYRIERRKFPITVSAEQNLWLFAGCVTGALVGAKLLACLEHLSLFWSTDDQATAWIGGKTIVGGLLGGWLGIEIVKRISGIRSSTGDAFVLPLICGIAVGSIGCFVTGLPDLTCGSPTNLPWAINFGDEIGRHPAQLYEILFLILLASSLPSLSRSFPASGSRFRLFLAGYFGFRWFSEFYKPADVSWFFLSPIQWACLLGCILALTSLFQCQTVLTSSTN